jgi:hypothetical protein
MKKNLTLLFISILLSFSGYAAGGDSTLVASFPLNGKADDITGKHKPGKVSHAKPAPGHDGKEAGALRFTADPNSFVDLPVNAESSKIPVLTITAWVNPHSSSSRNPLITTGDGKRGRGLVMDNTDNAWHWGAQSRDGVIDGPVVIANQWTFIAIMYDFANQQVRFIVNGELFKSRSKTGYGADKITIGMFDGSIDDINIYSRFLTLPELEALYGKKINATPEDLVVEDRFAYKHKRDKEEAESVKPGDIYLVDIKDFVLHDSVHGQNNKAVMHTGDSIYILEITGEKGDWLLVTGKAGDTGFISRSYLTTNAYSSESSSMAHNLKYTAQHIFNFTSLRSWIIVLIMAAILFFAKKYFYKIDELLNRLRKKDVSVSGGSKSGALAEKQTILNKVFPVWRMPWWSLTLGAILGIVLFAALMIDGGETEWFFNQGISLIPNGYDRWIHWVLYGLMWLMILGLVGIILESYVVTGPAIMWLRIFILLLLNIMALVVSFYLALVVLIIFIVMIVLTVLASGRSNYRCPHCGRSFSASGGSSGTCPHCGGGVRT